MNLHARRERGQARGVEDYQRLTGSRNLLEFLQQSPFAEAVNSGDLDLERARDLDRDIPL